jgi:hypothetical protein
VGSISAAVPEFWQQFPKALEAEGTTIRVRLFPGRFGDPFELQGGEQKTHTVWFDFGPTEGDPSESLAWVHEPGRLVVSPEWYSESGVVPHLVPAEPGGRLEEEMAKAIDGPRSLFTRRETIDEYGWRNFGDVHADHEGAYFQGEPPVISHYNNQYDLLLGMILQHARSGDGRWFELLEPLARHVCDIDIYHTDRDKSAYNGGLFWHTEHYRTAETSTHRTFSRANKPADGRPYGGGPSAEHNYTTGLLYYYYLTGDETAREAVESLADWAMKADDGHRTIFGLVDKGPTGFSSRTAEWSYHGPGRGCGNSVNALIDGWLLTGRRSYLRMAESLIGRCIHPADRIEERDLLSTELRWSYTVFLSVLDRYLSVKAEAGERDRMYAYAQASLLHYATWMLENEVPYFDRPEQLEYPTETWAAQELRKGNVLRLASAHADEPLRSRLKARGDELADRAWSDLLRFESRDVARALAILMREGTVDAYCRSRPIVPAPRPEGDADFGAPVVFVAQKDHVRSLLKSPTGMLRATWRIALSLARNPRLLTEGPQ